MALLPVERTDSLEHLKDPEPWMVAEDIPDMDFFFAQVWLRFFPNESVRSCGLAYKRVLSFFRGYHMQFYFGAQDAHDMAKHLVGKLKHDPGWGDVVNQNIVRFSDELVAHARSVHRLNLKHLSNADLWNQLEEHLDRHVALYEWGWLPNASDMFYPELTNYLKSILRSKADSEEQVNTWFVTLTTSEKETIATQEHKDLIRLALAIQHDALLRALFEKGAAYAEKNTPPEWKSRFLEIHQKYRHLKFMYHRKPGTLEDVYFALEPLLSEKKDLAAELSRLENLSQNTKTAKEALFRKLSLSEKHRHLFLVFGEFMYTKWHRRNAQILTLFLLEPLLREIAKRLGLSLENVRTLLSDEIKTGLEGNKIDPKKIDERFRYFAYYTEKGKEQLFIGTDAEKLEQAAKTIKIDTNLKELQGQTACLGKATGTVRILHGAKDLPKMKKGDILVAIATDPDIVPAMKIASAIVTEQGGVTSHAAIVSRELNIPCVIGTKIATKWLKDGDRVEVDATKGLVRKLS
ncbi:MAG TPA: PEP-utilizing enzyme [Candidatus Norongarragalinales archaeon]|nr:PEP-utilizing enzyme [Candidatus Norongarragalinales archaeon]